MDKDLEFQLTVLDASVRRVERMLQLWLRTNHGTLTGKKPMVDHRSGISEKEAQELVDLVYGNVW